MTKAEATDAMERMKAATRHIVSVPKVEVDRRAKAWAKARKRKRRKS